MADDRYNWLDNDAAERLLRGEPVGTTAHGAQELARLLDDAAPAGPGPAPLPGEEAAVAAFRRAHHAVPARAGLARPVRRGFVVALAACALGGVAVAAGTGVLHSPFRPGPAPPPSISTDVSPGPFESPAPGTTTPGSPDATAGERPTDATTSPTPDTSHSATPSPSGTTRGPGRGVPGLPGNGKNGSAERRSVVLALCRDYEAGKRGDMDRETVQRLERAAGGPAKAHAFCRRYLQQQGNGNSGNGGNGGNGNGDGGDGGGNGDGNADGGNAGTGQGGGHGGDEDGDGQPSTAPETPAPAPGSPEPSASDTVTPTPSTSADGTAPASV